MQINNQFNESQCRKELARMFIVAKLPFRFVKNKAFVSYSNVLQPKFIVPSHRTLRRDCLELYSAKMGKMEDFFFPSLLIGFV